jgi:hypothetical protein
MACFTQAQLQAIADALGDTSDGLTGSEIAHLLGTCGIADVNPTITKRHRLFNAFVLDQNQRRERTRILGFIRHSIKPVRFVQSTERFEPMRARLNQALAFAGLAIEETGQLVTVDQARTLSEAQRRAQEMRGDLTCRGVHPDVLRFCREELLADNYFHAVLEAVKGVADKLRARTGLIDDGATLVDRALAGDPPMLAINPLDHHVREAVFG